ncbi:unnamed protein product [Boreogadus saida]
MRWNDDRMEDAVKGSPSVGSYGSTLREAVDKLSRKILCTRPEESTSVDYPSPTPRS